MGNNLTDLNNHLFSQLDRLSDASISDEALEKEVSRTGALVDVSDQILKNASIHLQAVKLGADIGQTRVKEATPMIAGNNTSTVPAIEGKATEKLDKSGMTEKELFDGQKFEDDKRAKG